MSKYVSDPDAVSTVGSFKKGYLFAGLLVVAVMALSFLAYTGRLGNFGATVSEAPNMEKISTKYEKTKAANVEKVALPTGPEITGKPWAKFYHYDWHGHAALALANGGRRTLDDSFIGKENVILDLEHQDNTMISIEAFLASVDEFKQSNGARGGNVMFSIMGNSSVSLIQPINDKLKTIDPSYKAVAVALLGKSDGEDQIIGPAELEKCPECWKGKVLVGVYDDGDVQLGFAMLDKMGVKVNFNYKTWDPDALNLAHVADFKDAGLQFINNTTYPPRPVYQNGKATGKTTSDLGIELKPDLVASWTPVDRNVYLQLKAAKDPRLKGLKTLVSTGKGEERGVMPTTLIVFNKWAEQPRNTTNLANMIYANHKAADQIDNFDEALTRSMEICTDIMGNWDGTADPKDTVKARIEAYKGFDAPGSGIRIGGSTVFSFKDAMNMLSIDDSGNSNSLSNSMFASVYRAFGKVTVERYPEKEMKSFDPFESFFDPRYIKIAILRAKNEGYQFNEIVQRQEFGPGNTGEVVGGTNFKINFKSGSAELDASGLKIVQDIQDKYASSEYGLVIVGHTDKTGSLDQNKELSKRRAEAVKNILVSRNAQVFGGNRITTDGKGFDEPPKGTLSYTGACDACRRVEIQIVKLK